MPGAPRALAVLLLAVLAVAGLLVGVALSASFAVRGVEGLVSLASPVVWFADPETPGVNVSLGPGATSANVTVETTQLIIINYFKGTVLAVESNATLGFQGWLEAYTLECTSGSILFASLGLVNSSGAQTQTEILVSFGIIVVNRTEPLPTAPPGGASGEWRAFNVTMTVYAMQGFDCTLTLRFAYSFDDDLGVTAYYPVRVRIVSPSP